MGLFDRLLGVDTDDPMGRFEAALSVSDPRVLELMGGPFGVDNGLPNVSEAEALMIPAYTRAEEIIVNTLAGLPLKVYESSDAGRKEVLSVLDEPQGPESPGSRHDWIATLYTQAFRYRELYLKPIKTTDGVQVGIEIIHPRAVVNVQKRGWGKVYTVKMADNRQRDFSSDEIRQVLFPPFVGALRGSPVYVFSKPLFQVAIAAMGATGRVFTGAMLAGLVTPTAEDPSEWPDDKEAQVILDHLNAKLTGVQNAGQFRFVNHGLKVDRWQQTNEEAQWGDAQDDVVEGFSRLSGVPPHLLAQTDKQTSWGTGVAEQNTGLSRYTLTGYSDAVESALRWFLQRGQHVETNYKGLLAGTPAQEIQLLMLQTGGKAILSVDEARAVLNLPPNAALNAPEPVEAPSGIRG